jgi:predicted outer membrane repeat protein
VVVSDIGAPIRDADIILSGQQVREGKSDDNGRFEFDGLQAGRFYLSVTKAGFGTQVTTIQSSATAQPSIELSDGQTLDRTVTLPRGGVIKGRLVDASGEPLANADMRVERFVYGPGGRQLAQHSGPTPNSWMTNDLGEFRVFGLAPGAYLVSARTRQFGAPVTMGAGGARDRAEGLIPTYFPGTTRLADARSVRVAAGQEVVADFVATTGRLLRVSGTVRNSRGAPPAGHNVFLGVQTSNSSGQINGGAIAADGSFSVGNVPPGDYTLRVRQQGGGTPDGEVAWMPISLSTEDLTGVQLTTQRGVTLRGRVEWAGSAPRPTTTMRVSTRLAEYSGGPLGGESPYTYLDLESGTVKPDDTFELGGAVGRVLLSLAPQPWQVRSVTVNGKDVTDTGLDTASPDAASVITIVMTDRLTNVSGAVRDSQRPVNDYVVVVLPQKPIEGMGASRYTRVLRPDRDGAFSVRGLPTGEYVAAALDALESGREWDPEVQKMIRGAGPDFSLSEGQSLSLNLELLR